MWKLIQMEWKKNHIKKYVVTEVIGAAILGLLLFALCYWGIAVDPGTGVMDESAQELATMALQIDLFSNLFYVILTTAMMSSFIIKAYKNRTQNLMFSYPIPRKKILFSQMMAVWIFCGASLLITKLFLYVLLSLGYGLSASFPLGYDLTSPGLYVQMILKTILTVTLSLIPLYVGRQLKSSKAAIISSFLIFSVMNGTIGDLTLSGSFILPILMFAAALVCGFLTIFRAEQEDLM